MSCEHDQGTRWLEQAPDSLHRYRVECSFCHRFIKWGNQAELDRRILADETGWVVDYKAPPTLDAFFVKE